jgi:hypothetical protein
MTQQLPDPEPNYSDEAAPKLPRVKVGKMIYEFFPPGFIALNAELATGLHPALETILSKYDAEDVDIKLARIAKHVGIVLNGIYTLEARDKLCRVLAGRLEVLREIPSPKSVIIQ